MALLEAIQSPIIITLFMAIISALYFVLDRSNTLIIRIFSSAHGIIGAIFLVGAALISEFVGLSEKLSMLYAWLYVVPLASVIFSFIKFKGNPLIHFLQLPNLIFLAFSWLTGIMLISGNWL